MIRFYVTLPETGTDKQRILVKDIRAFQSTINTRVVRTFLGPDFSIRRTHFYYKVYKAIKVQWSGFQKLNGEVLTSPIWITRRINELLAKGWVEVKKL